MMSFLVPKPKIDPKIEQDRKEQSAAQARERQKLNQREAALEAGKVGVTGRRGRKLLRFQANDTLGAP